MQKLIMTFEDSCGESLSIPFEGSSPDEAKTYFYDLLVDAYNRGKSTIFTCGQYFYTHDYLDNAGHIRDHHSSPHFYTIDDWFNENKEEL